VLRSGQTITAAAMMMTMSTLAALTSVLHTARHIGASWRVPGTTFPLRESVSRVAHQVQRHAIPALAGNIAFRVMFAFFPSVISVLWILHAVNAGQLVADVSDLVGMIVPGIASGPIKEQIRDAPQTQVSGEFTLGVGLSLIVAIWAMAEVFRAAMHAMNVVYGVEERRSRLRRVATSVVVSAITMSLFVAALAVIVSGASLTAALGAWSGLGVGYGWIWWCTAWIVVVIAVLAAFSLTYYFAPDVEQRLRWVRTGSIMGVGLWLLFTGLFALYVNFLSGPSVTYGALAGVAFFMVYLYSSAFILLLGAEVNQVLENWEPDGKSSGERAPSD
jgi:membrane protein